MHGFCLVANSTGIASPTTVKPPIKDTPKENRPPNKGHYTNSVQNNLQKRTDLPTKDTIHNNFQKRTTSLQRTNMGGSQWCPLFGGSRFNS